MRRHFFLLASAFLALSTPAIAAPWVRGFVIDNYEPGAYYGGRGGSPEPGSDCPKGAIPDNDYRALLSTKWRTEAEIAPLLIRAGDEKSSEAAQATHIALETAISYRGFRRDIATYINPFAAPDPGIQQVTGKIADGFNLDGDARTGGFTSPAGERGIDNAYYRAMGCTQSLRDQPSRIFLGLRVKAQMMSGLFTMVIRISGNKNPMNDENATLEVGYSPDRPIMGGNDDVVRDYSFRIAKTIAYTRLKARIKNGVVESEQVADLRLPEFAWYPANVGEADLKKGKLRFTIGADGAVTGGLIGGYRDWQLLYARDAFDGPMSAVARETIYHQNEIGMYYALKRNADGFPDPKTGQNTAISIAYRFSAKPAYVIDPAKPVGMNPWQPADIRQRDAADDSRARFTHAVLTKEITQEPPQPARRGRPAAPVAQPADGSVQAANAPAGNAAPQ